LAVEPDVLLDGRTLFGPGPHRHPTDRRNDFGFEERYTIVIVTHNMQQAARVSEMTAYFLLGELVEFGPTGRRFHQPPRHTHRTIHHRPIRLTHLREENQMERHFDEDLRQLKERLLRMGAIAEEMIQKAVKALHERRDALTAEVFDLETQVNQCTWKSTTDALN
jgi:ABC-type methionine transport system ATPase subunit